MQAIILIGIQGAGKTTFFREHFFETHVRISLDMLRTRDRERLLLEACLAAQQPFVIDNTNVLATERAVYIQAARARGFKVTGYFFKTELRAAIARNNKRTDKKPLPVPALARWFKRLQPPLAQEGFDELQLVTLDPQNRFKVEPWSDTAL